MEKHTTTKASTTKNDRSGILRSILDLRSDPKDRDLISDIGYLILI